MQRGVGRSVFQLLLRPLAPNVLWRFLRHIGRFLDHLGGVDTPIGRALAPKIQAKLNKYMESGEINMPASIRASCTKFGLKVPETHKNISTPLWGINTPAGRMPVPKAGPSWAITFGVRSSISQLPLRPHAPNCFWRYLRHIGTFLDHLQGVDTPAYRVPVAKAGPSWAITFGVRSSISQLPLRPHAPNCFWRYLRHIGTFLDHLQGVDTPADRVPVAKAGPSWANTFGVGRSISWQSIKAWCTNFLDIPETHRNISRQLVRCWHTCRQSASGQSWDKLSKYIWGGVVNILVSIKAWCTNFLDIPGTHRNIPDHLRDVDTPMVRAPAPKPRPSWANTFGVGRSIISASIRAPCTKYHFGGS